LLFSFCLLKERGGMRGRSRRKEEGVEERMRE